jgi:hypothetical protein
MAKTSFYSGSGTDSTEAPAGTPVPPNHVTALDAIKAEAEAAQAAAETSETNAASSAAAAASSASTATTQASTATTQATNAASSATTATTQANTATTQATNAAASASTASTHASTATTKATEAATSATNAASSATASETAKTASETAKTASETAKTASETAETNAAASATAAAASAASINSYTGGTGITVSGTTITNDSPDQTVALTAGSNVSVSGTYPNFTISSTDTNTTYSVGDNGLTEKNFTTTLKNKLDAIEASADVTDTTNVTSAGALMDSEVTNLAQVKAFDSSDYATAAQGATADAAMPTSGGTFTGDISFEGATANDYETTVTVADPTADRTITLPDQTGTAMLWQSAWPDDPTDGNGIAIGDSALSNANSSAVFSTAVGHNAGSSITSGERNTLIGSFAGDNLTTGTHCTAVGQSAMGQNTTDSNTTAIGALSGRGDFLTGGTYVGAYAGNFNASSKDYQVAIGYSAMDDCNGDNSTAVGAYSMSDGNHYHSVGVGYYALGRSSSSNPYYNVTVGNYAGNALYSGDYNTIMGYNADVIGNSTSYAVAIGGYCDTAGHNSVSIGYQASASSLGGSDSCVLIGFRAGYDMDNGDYCTFVGYNAGYNGGAGNYNTSVGSTSLYQLTSGEKNSAFGNNCLQSITSGDYNTGVGSQAGQAATTGSNNTVLGYYAGQIQDGSTANQLTTGSNVTCVGSESMPSSGTATNEITLGDNDITSLRCNVQTISSLSDERDKTAIKDLTFGLDFINDMRPVEFTWNRRDGSLGAKTDMGFIAQELYDTELDHSSSSRTRLVNWDNPEKLEADYVRSYPILVKAVQELSAKCDALEARLAALEGA